MNSRLPTVFAWSAPAFLLIFLPCFLLMGFFPPPRPMLPVDEVRDLYASHKYQILFSSAFLMNFSPLCLLWVAAISAQIKRVQSPHAELLASAQLICGAVNLLLLLPPAMMWTLAAFRPDTRSPEFTSLLNDAGWITLLMPVGPAIVQTIIIALAILLDRGAEPIYPRWAAFVNIWVGLAFYPSIIVAFFKHGPFAWNGVFDFYLPVLSFTGWLIMMAFLTARAAKGGMPSPANGQN